MESNTSSEKFFPLQLMTILDNDDASDAISWLPHGRGFVIHDKKKVEEDVLPRYFNKHSKYSSFTRRLTRWDFTIQCYGHRRSAYFNPLFIKGERDRCLQMRPLPQKKYSSKAYKGVSGDDDRLPQRPSEPNNRTVSGEAPLFIEDNVKCVSETAPRATLRETQLGTETQNQFLHRDKPFYHPQTSRKEQHSTSAGNDSGNMTMHNVDRPLRRRSLSDTALYSMASTLAQQHTGHLFHSDERNYQENYSLYHRPRSLMRTQQAEERPQSYQYYANAPQQQSVSCVTNNQNYNCAFVIEDEHEEYLMRKRRQPNLRLNEEARGFGSSAAASIGMHGNTMRHEESVYPRQEGYKRGGFQEQNHESTVFTNLSDDEMMKKLMKNLL